jgi:hypothetical protein
MVPCRRSSGRCLPGSGTRTPPCVTLSPFYHHVPLANLSPLLPKQVVFKSLIVLHQILRAGSLEPTFSYLASSSLSLTLSAHEAPNISAYGHYLAARIKSYSNIKRDVIRDKSDRRAASRLRGLKVEGGLLRETREVQRMIAALVESKVCTLCQHSRRAAASNRVRR